VKIAHHVAIYPVLHVPAEEQTERTKRLLDGWVLFPAFTKEFDRLARPKNQELLDSPLYRPLKATSFDKMPPGQVVVGEIDRLCDEGIRYYETLKNAGVDVTLHKYPSGVHGFFTLYYLPEATKAFGDVIKVLKEKVF